MKILIIEVSEYGLAEPEFIDMECALKINVFRKGENDTIFDTSDTILDTNDTVPDTIFDANNERISDIIDEAERDLLRIIHEFPDKSQQEYAKLINVSIATTKRLFAKLQEKGLVYREGTNRKGRWLINEK